MKKLYTKPEVDITVYRNADVIATVNAISSVQTNIPSIGRSEITDY